MGRVTARAAPGGPRAVPGARDPRRPFPTSPFARLARAHAAGIAGDALFAIGLAGSVFFSLDFDAARWRVALYLVLTIAPFAVAAPLIGPTLDRMRGGRRWIIVASMALRAVLCVLVVRHLDSLLFYPEAFGMLVLGKVYTISKSALVPTTVRSDAELVEANSKLAVLSAVAVVVAALPGGLLLKLGGAGWTLGLAVIAFVVATLLSLRLPPVSVADQAPGAAEREELRSAGIRLAASAMAVVRGVVGFLAFMLAFAFKNADAPLWYLGVVAASAQLGFFLGAVVAPRLRRVATEERMLTGNLVVTAVAGLVCALLGGLPGAMLLSLLVGLTSSASKQAFDAIVQRDAPDANRGRSFARFETRFQLVWVLGALVPIVVPIPAPAGFLVVAVLTGFAAASYAVGQWRIRQGRVPPARGPRLRLPGRGAPGEPPPGDRPPGGEPHRADQTLVSPTAGGRGWVRERPAPAGGWAPPPGFVSRPLAGETAVDGTVVTTTGSATPAPWPRVFDAEPDATDHLLAESGGEGVHDGHPEGQLSLPLDAGPAAGQAGRPEAGGSRAESPPG